MKSHLLALAILALPLAVPVSAAAQGFADLTVEEQADLTCGTAIATISPAIIATQRATLTSLFAEVARSEVMAVP